VAVLASAGAPAVATAAASAATATGAAASSVLVAFARAHSSASLARQLAREHLSLAIMSAAQGTYTPAQLGLDVSQGARIASARYPTSRAPVLELAPAPQGGGQILGWAAARARAERAPQLLRPGLLGSRVPGGGAYAGELRGDGAHAALAADEGGHVATVSLGTSQTLVSRVVRLLGKARLVVCDLPPGRDGALELLALGRLRASRELEIVVEGQPGGAQGQLLWLGTAGLASGPASELTSDTTNQRGLVSSIDLAPTILRHLGVRRLPADVRGATIRPDGALAVGGLESLMARLRVIGPRRLRALGVLLCVAAALLLAAALARGPRAPARRARALRVCGLAVLWSPAVALLAAALQPGATAEYAVIAGGAFALALLGDAALRWPLALIAPALVTLLAFVADALARWQLLVRSLLGPNPILGARFYGFGNELKSGLAVAVLFALAAALYGRRRAGRAPTPQARHLAAAFVAAGALLALIEGWSRIGAAVGGVVLVCAATAVAAATLLPGGVTRRRALIALLSPAAGLVLLAALDLATAHGSGHYTGSILHARSAGDLRDVLVRRYGAAWSELHNHAVPAATAVALACAVLALRLRDRVLAPVRADPAFVAALAGSVTAGVVGSLVEDSGPVLLVVAVFTLGSALSYLSGRPRRRAGAGPRTSAARSDAAATPALRGVGAKTAAAARLR
jgi:hypothetical protein